MAKIVKKIETAGRKLKALSAATREVFKKAAAKKTTKRKVIVSKAKTLPAARLTALETKYLIPAQNRTSDKTISRSEPVLQLEKTELPRKYDKDLIVAQVRDPWWLHTYWEVRNNTWQRLKSELSKLFESAKRVLRAYDVSFINFNGANAHRYFDIEVPPNADGWYIDTGSPGRSWCVDFGLKLEDGRFITIVRSNIVNTPLDGPSWVTDEEWMVPDDLFVKLYAGAVGLGGSPVKIKKPWLELKKRMLSSGGISSVGFSPVRKKEEYKRKFWLVVNTELIVYGATEPDARVTVAGVPVTLRPDGTFSLRFALPDGKQVIPVEAVSADKIDKKIITPIVTKETK